jgi:hypothetical protein
MYGEEQFVLLVCYSFAKDIDGNIPSLPTYMQYVTTFHHHLHMMFIFLRFANLYEGFSPDSTEQRMPTCWIILFNISEYIL